MIKKRSILLAIITLTAALAEAQLPFEVQAPSFRTVVISKAENGSQIRKAPSLQAPRLVIDDNKITDYHTPAIYSNAAYWSTAKNRGAVSSITFTGPAVPAEKKDGWYRFPGIGLRGVDGWVAASTCNEMTLTDITPYNINNWPPCFKLFDYNGEQYFLELSLDELEGIQKAAVGKLNNGKIVMPYCIYWEDDVPEWITWSSDPEAMNSHNLNKLTRKQLLTVITNIINNKDSKLAKPLIYVYGEDYPVNIEQ